MFAIIYLEALVTVWHYTLLAECVGSFTEPLKWEVINIKRLNNKNNFGQSDSVKPCNRF